MQWNWLGLRERFTICFPIYDVTFYSSQRLIIGQVCNLKRQQNQFSLHMGRSQLETLCGDWTQHQKNTSQWHAVWRIHLVNTLKKSNDTDDEKISSFKINRGNWRLSTLFVGQLLSWPRRNCCLFGRERKRLDDESDGFWQADFVWPVVLMT